MGADVICCQPGVFSGCRWAVLPLVVVESHNMTESGFLAKSLCAVMEVPHPGYFHTFRMLMVLPVWLFASRTAEGWL